MKASTIFKPLIIILLCALFSPSAFACQPCLKERSLNLEQSIAQAKLIVVGKRVFNNAPIKEGYEWQRDAPPFIEVSVDRVLKGKEKKKLLNVHSYSGICPYGVVVNDAETYIFILGGASDRYGAVERCSVKALHVKRGGGGAPDEVDIGDGKMITLDELQQKFIVNPRPTGPTSISPKRGRKPLKLNLGGTNLVSGNLKKLCSELS